MNNPEDLKWGLNTLPEDLKWGLNTLPEMLPEEVEQVNEELLEKFITREQVKNPARIRKMTWDMIDESHNALVKKVTNMYLYDEINKEEYSIMMHIIATVIRKIKTMHT